MKKIKKISLVLLTLLMVLSLVSCSGSNEPSSNAGDKTSYTYAVGGSPNYMDPAIASDSIGSYVINQMFFPLFYLSPDGLQKGACDDYTVSDDGLVYTVKLIENYWSDGQKVTAEDYVYGAKHALSLGDAEVTYLAWITDYIENAKDYVFGDANDMPKLGIKALDESTIEYTLIKPVDFFTQLLWGGIYYPLRPDFAPSGDYTWADTVGYPMNGAFVPTYIDRAAKVVFEKNEKWCWADKVSLQTLTAQVMEDMDAQLMAFQTGEIDHATSVDAATVSQLPELADSFYATGVINYYAQINMRPESATNKALTDLNVRKALVLGVDREELVDARNDGVTTPLYGFVPAGIVSDSEGDFRKAGGDYCSYDPEKAAEYLAKAGYSVDKPLTLVYYYNQNAAHDLVAAVLKEQYAKIGINLELKTADVRTFFADRDENAAFELARGAMSADYNDSLSLLDMATSTYQMKASWGDKQYDKLMSEASFLSGQERLNKLHDAEKYLIEDQAMVIPLFQYGSACLRNTAFTGDLDNIQGNSLFWFVKAAN